VLVIVTKKIGIGKGNLKDRVQRMRVVVKTVWVMKTLCLGNNIQLCSLLLPCGSLVVVFVKFKSGEGVGLGTDLLTLLSCAAWEW